MTQLKLFSNEWGLNEGFKPLADQLNELLPMEGKCEFPNSKNKHLEKFRKTQRIRKTLRSCKDGRRRRKTRRRISRRRIREGT